MKKNYALVLLVKLNTLIYLFNLTVLKKKVSWNPKLKITISEGNEIKACSFCFRLLNNVRMRQTILRNLWCLRKKEKNG